MSFEFAFNQVVGIERDFSDDPNDSGGTTRYGITEATARAAGYQGDMRALPIALAKSIYRRRYWDALRLDDIDARVPALAEELFDTAVNQGQGTAATYLQISLNAFNHRGRRYSDIAVDGSIGPATLGALGAFLQWRGGDGAKTLLKALNCLQGARYLDLAQRREKDEDFVYGWIKNRIAL
jgi:lysozyme family protein